MQVRLQPKNKLVELKNLTVGDIFTYSDEEYLFSEVRREGLSCGLLIDYCHPNTVEYDKYGVFCCKVSMVIDTKLLRDLSKGDPNVYRK